MNSAVALVECKRNMGEKNTEPPTAMNPLEYPQQTKGIDMTIRIKYEGLALPPSPMFTLCIANSLAIHEHENAVTISFEESSTAPSIVAITQ